MLIDTMSHNHQVAVRKFSRLLVCAKLAAANQRHAQVDAIEDEFDALEQGMRMIDRDTAENIIAAAREHARSVQDAEEAARVA